MDFTLDAHTALLAGTIPKDTHTQTAAERKTAAIRLALAGKAHDPALAASLIDLTIEQVGSVTNLSAEVAAIADLRRRAARDEREATSQAVALAKRLAGEGVTVRDIGSALGVTFQRAHQLVSA